jgi:hypothetical protein
LFYPRKGYWVPHFSQQLAEVGSRCPILAALAAVRRGRRALYQGTASQLVLGEAPKALTRMGADEPQNGLGFSPCALYQGTTSVVP